MTAYTVRVELHDAEGFYDDLHEAMKAQGFNRWISIDGVKFQLPTAEYSIPQTDLSASQVLARAERAANLVKPRPQPSILVTKTEVCRYHSGLKN